MRSRPPVWTYCPTIVFVAPMTGLEFHRVAGGPEEMHAYDADHCVRDPQAAVDRLVFLRPLLAG